MILIFGTRGKPRISWPRKKTVTRIKNILTFRSGAEIIPLGRLGDPMTSAQYLFCKILFSLSKSWKYNRLKLAITEPMTLQFYWLRKTSDRKQVDKTMLHVLKHQLFPHGIQNEELLHLFVFSPSPIYHCYLCQVCAPN